jgi:hypothetical protein
MSPEPIRHFPNWAERERQGDLRWIGENVHILWPAAHTGFETLGRGAITVDTTIKPVPGLINPFTYLSQAELQPLRDQDMERIVRQYDPTKELVVVLFKTQQRTSTYRIQPQPRQ